MTIVLTGNVRDKSVSMSIHRKILKNSVMNVCNAKHVLNVHFKDQKPNIMLFVVDGSYYIFKKTSRDYGIENPSAFWKMFSTNYNRLQPILCQKR